MSEVRQGRITRSALIELLAPHLGVEKSTQLVLATAAKLGYWQADSYTRTEANAILRILGTTDGLVGVVARFAVSRVSSVALPRSSLPGASPFGRALSAPSFPATSPGSEPARPPPPPKSTPQLPDSGRGPTMALSELEDLFAPTVGVEKARSLLHTSCLRLSVGAGPYSRTDALAIVDGMTDEDGLVGVVARFARARILLKLPG
jgi:hypothetical protein